MNIAELIENWKKQREEIDQLPWNYEHIEEGVFGVYAKDDEVVGEIYGRSLINADFIVSAPKTIEALTKALEEVSKILKCLDSEFLKARDKCLIENFLTKNGFVK